MNQAADDGGAVAAATELLELVEREPSITKVMDKVCQLGRVVVGADAACIMVLDRTELRFAHAAPEPYAVMGRLQDRLQAGPCRESIDHLRVVSAGTDQLARWPAMASAASTLGITTVLSTPLVARGRAWGSLDLYGASGHRWDATSVQAATLLARIAATAIASPAVGDNAWRARMDLEHRATHDALTDLPNRALLFDRLEHAMLGINRHRHALAVVFIDLDHFKAINDSLGHAAGDEVLVDVADRLSAIVRESDTLARLSGDEFVVICEDLQGEAEFVRKGLEDLSRRIHATLARPFAALPVQLTVSIGIAVYPAGMIGLSGRHLLSTADNAMYEAKWSGPGQTVIRASA